MSARYASALRRPPSPRAAGRWRSSTRYAREYYLRHGQARSFGGPLGINHETVLWGWPLAARTAHDLGDANTTSELLTMLDSYPPGHLPSMLKAERALVHARLSARDGDPGAAESFAAAVRGLRDLSTPYHLAHGLRVLAAAW